MSPAFSILWRLLLALALVVNPLAGLRSAAAMASAGNAQAPSTVPCHQVVAKAHAAAGMAMAGMAAAPGQVPCPHRGCVKSACPMAACCGTAVAFALAAMPLTPWFGAQVQPRGTAARIGVSPPLARSIRPPIA